MRYRDELAGTRPELVAGYDAALPGATAEVLGRLWGALSREPVPGLLRRRRDGSGVAVDFDNGHSVTGPIVGIISQALPELTLDGRAVGDPLVLIRALWPTPAGERLSREIRGSIDGLALARAHRPEADHSARDTTWYEQGVVDGHPVHPCCRNRTGMSLAEVFAYAPEHRPVFDLPLVAVPRKRLLAPAPNWPLTDGPDILLPVHPWQRDHVLPRYGLAPTASIRARPLMALRTVATDQWQIKTSLDMQLTAVRRGLSRATIHDGPELSTILPDPPGLTLLREVHATGIDPHMSAILRTPPEHHLRAGQTAIPLTALTTLTAKLDVGAAIQAIVPPLLHLLHLGIASQAHGQNVLLTLGADGRPDTLLYRDFTGIRISPRRFGTRPPLHGNLFRDDPDVVHARFTGAMIMTIAELIHATGDETLWAHVAHTIDTTYADLPDDDWNRRHHTLFHAPTLPVRAYTTMRLADDRTDTWGWTPNPYTAYR